MFNINRLTPKELFSQSSSLLIFHFPFFGGVVLGTNLINTDSVPTMATDGKSIFYNLKFVAENTVEQNSGVLTHEVKHITDKHPLRLNGRDSKLWNISTDLGINNYLKPNGVGLVSYKDPNVRLDLPEGGYFELPQFGLTRDVIPTLTVDQIYNILHQNKDGEDGAGNLPEPSWGGVEEPTNEDGSSMSSEQKQSLESKIDRQIVNAGNSAKTKGVGALTQDIQEIIDTILEPKIDWREAFTFHWQGGDNNCDYSYRRINKKHFAGWGSIDPIIVKNGCGNVGVLDDCSASVSKKEKELGFTELNMLSEDLTPESITVIPFTDIVYKDGIRKFETGEVVSSLNWDKTGGTNVITAFKFIEDNWSEYNFQKLVIFTDCEISNYGDEPSFSDSCQIIWVCTQSKKYLKRYNCIPPYGEVIYIGE